MKYSFIPRADDFRFAWANAFAISLEQVGELQDNGDCILRVSKDMLEQLVEQTDYLRASLTEARNRIVDQMQATHSKNLAATEAATQRLIKQADSNYLAQLRQQVETKSGERELEQKRAKFEAQRMKYVGESLWVRLWFAFKKRH